MDPIKLCLLYKEQGCAHVDGYLCNVESCPERAAYEIAKGWAKEIDRQVIENLRAGAERNTDDHCGYEEGTWENYEAFRKKREESLRIPEKKNGRQ